MYRFIGISATILPQSPEFIGVKFRARLPGGRISLIKRHIMSRDHTDEELENGSFKPVASLLE
jgi:hypothetical protein